MKRYLIPITFPKTKGTASKAWIQYGPGCTWVYIEAPSAAAAGRELATRIRPSDDRRIRFLGDLKSWNIDQPAVSGNESYPSLYVMWTFHRHREYLWAHKPGCCGTAWEARELADYRAQLEESWRRKLAGAQAAREEWVASQGLGSVMSHDRRPA